MSHTHSHAHPSEHRRASRRTIRFTAGVLIPAALATLIGLIVLWPGKADSVEPWTGAPAVEATVLAVHETVCPPVGDQEPGTKVPERRCGTVTLKVTDGPGTGRQVQAELPSGQGAPHVVPGDSVVLMVTGDSADPQASVYQIMSHERSSALIAVFLAFLLAVVGFGRWRGVRALGGLAFTFAVLLMFVVPAILDGSPPLLVAIVGASAIMLVVLFLTHGINLPTSMAVLGTLASLMLAGLLALLSTSMLKLTGIGSEEDSFLSMQYPGVNMLGLLLAGILIGALGVLDDVTVTQATTVTELAHANPDMGFARLYKAAERVGRAHITSVINTIVLAYAGASLPVLLLIVAGGASLPEMLTSEWLTQEIVRSIVGTLGLIAAVPITTALTALTLSREAPRRRVPSPPRRRLADPPETVWSGEDTGAVANPGPRRW
nr:YibE/F family protein [Catelliglobosispora koreensis]